MLSRMRLRKSVAILVTALVCGGLAPLSATSIDARSVESDETAQLSTKTPPSNSAHMETSSATEAQEPEPFVDSTLAKQSVPVTEYEHVIARIEQQKWDIRTRANLRGSVDTIDVAFPSLGQVLSNHQQLKVWRVSTPMNSAPEYQLLRLTAETNFADGYIAVVGDKLSIDFTQPITLAADAHIRMQYESSSVPTIDPNTVSITVAGEITSLPEPGEKQQEYSDSVEQHTGLCFWDTASVSWVRKRINSRLGYEATHVVDQDDNAPMRRDALSFQFKNSQHSDIFYQPVVHIDGAPLEAEQDFRLRYEENQLTITFSDSRKIRPGSTIKVGFIFRGDTTGGYSPRVSKPTVEVRVCELDDDEVSDSSAMGFLHTTVVPNPPVVHRCGQRVGVVFDLSASIGDDGLAKFKEAGLGIINGLRGTSTELGIYNFASYSPAMRSDTTGRTWTNPLDMQSSENVDRLINTVKALAIDRQAGGTNWEAGLANVLKQNLDIVYFVTDGQPTNYVGWEEQWAQAPAHWLDKRDYDRLNWRLLYEQRGDAGYVTHVSDINRAVTIANAIKEQGTRVEAVSVGLRGNRIGVLRDEAAYQQDGDYWEYYYPRAQWGEARYAWGVPEKNRGFWGAHPGIPKPENVEDIYGSTADNVYRSYSEAIAGWTTDVDMLQYISGGKRGEDYHVIKDFQAVTDALVRRVLQECHNKVIVKKKLTEYISGTENVSYTGGEKVAGWNFGAQVGNSGNVRLIHESATTDLEGEAAFEYRRSSAADGEIVITENLGSQPDVALKSVATGRDGSPQYARCTRNGRQVKVGAVRDSTSSQRFKQNAFSVAISTTGMTETEAFGPIVCEVENIKNSRTISVAIQKFGLDGNNSSRTHKVAGAHFELFVANPKGSGFRMGNKLQDFTPVPGQEGFLALPTEIAAGTYYLVEQRAPDGYHLLPAPVLFRIESRPGSWPKGTIVNSADTPGVDVHHGKGNPKHNVVFYINDIQQGDLPLTGGSGVHMWALCAAALFSTALAMVVRNRRA
ncbi:hypothetical protein CMUST_00420 [Corynebacterium mustelae]|uniref:SpaA-like prealbumin fold domain-containing protein n=1 Tax=Corynebacterium mustelae TaxID=571915 RepID=A0A0G3GTD6_9CORY|nr:SpaA isopeptide-forming pilin-related protein [Corynebacterium mustelae]AKK04441.1 hypothetical protein CMUST_00420 [Corynebacterium mustelae]